LPKVQKWYETDHISVYTSALAKGTTGTKQVEQNHQLMSKMMFRGS